MPIAFKPFHSKRKNPVARGAAWVSHVVRSLRGPMETPWQRFVGRIETLFIDDGFFLGLMPNRARLSDRMERGAQPQPWQIAKMAKQGIRTIINLRGSRDCATYFWEREACRKHGIRLVDFPVNSRQPPKLEVLEQLDRLFSSIEYPAFMHCKAGSDRAGIMSALYLLLAEKRPVGEAKRQLSWRFGHVKHAKTGVLDAFLETYRRDTEKTPMDFMTWARRHYNRDAVIAAHKPFRAAEWFYKYVLRRE